MPFPASWSRRRRVLEIFIQLVIFYSIATYLCELEFAENDLSLKVHPFFYWSEAIVALIFTVEFVVRTLRKPRHPVTFLGIIDLLAILPFYASLFVSNDALGAVRMLRLLRVLKVYRYNKPLRCLGKTFWRIRAELAAIIVLVAMLVIGSGTTMYALERECQPEAFDHISDGWWWAWVTFTTIGYGDTYPQSGLGRLLAVTMSFVGVPLLAYLFSLFNNSYLQTLKEEGDIVFD